MTGRDRHAALVRDLLAERYGLPQRGMGRASLRPAPPDDGAPWTLAEQAVHARELVAAIDDAREVGRALQRDEFELKGRP